MRSQESVSTIKGFIATGKHDPDHPVLRTILSCSLKKAIFQTVECHGWGYECLDQGYWRAKMKWIVGCVTTVSQLI